MGETDRSEPAEVLTREGRRARVLVSGRVQGVFFRAEARREAAARGLSGWVRNRPEGDVEAVFQGIESAIHEMIRWCEHGPAGAHVTGVEVFWATPEPEPASFQVLP